MEQFSRTPGACLPQPSECETLIQSNAYLRLVPRGPIRALEGSGYSECLKQLPVSEYCFGQSFRDPDFDNI